jgi:hypothetical protein
VDEHSLPGPAGAPTRWALAARVLTLALIGSGVWIALPHCGPIVVGAAIAAVVAFLLRSRCRPHREHFRSPVIDRLGDAVDEPVVSLARTARPLIMPLLGALAVGTFQLLWPIQLAPGGVFVTTAWWIVILPESRSIKAMLEAQGARRDVAGIR